MTTSDLAETLSLVFCGAEVGCFSGDPAFPSPAALAEQAGQRLQMEFLLHNKNSGKGLRDGLFPLLGASKALRAVVHKLQDPVLHPFWKLCQAL